MEFWGVEVKPGQTLKVKPDQTDIIHISQAALGEFKNAKGNVNVALRLKIDGKSFVIGFLSTEDRPQMMADLVFEKEFELSHDWKNGSVYFTGYKADDGYIFTNDEFGDEEISSDEDVELPNGLNVKGEPQKNDSDDSGSDSDSESADIEELEGDSSSDDEPLPGELELDTSSSDEEPEEKQLRKQPAKPAAVLPSVTKKPNSAPQKTGGKKAQDGKGPSPKNATKGKNVKRSFQKKA